MYLCVMTQNQNTPKEKTYFSSKMKLADLIDINFNLLSLLPRLNVSLALGGHTIEDVCRECSLDVNTFLLLCNVYTYDEYVPSGEILGKSNVENIVSYLKSSHSSYLDTSLVTLESSIERLLEPCNDKQKAIIWKFFSGYKEEIKKHFAYEETEVFPYIDSLLRGEMVEGFSINQFEDNHSNIEEKLSDLKNIVMMYLPAECDNTQRSQVLIFIYHLEQDLACHTRIEDGVLVPVVNRIEENVRK